MEERRQDYPKILDALEDIKVEMTKVATKVEERNDSAVVWRNDVCKKFDKIFTWLEKLPCRERDERYKSIDKVLFYLKLGIGFAIALIIAHLGWR